MTAAATPAAPQSPWWIPRSGCPCLSCLDHPDPTAPAHRPPGCNRSTPPEVPHLTRVGPQRDPIPSPRRTTPWSNASTLTATWGVAVGRGVCQRLELGLSARRAHGGRGRALPGPRTGHRRGHPPALRGQPVLTSRRSTSPGTAGSTSSKLAMRVRSPSPAPNAPAPGQGRCLRLRAASRSGSDPAAVSLSCLCSCARAASMRAEMAARSLAHGFLGSTPPVEPGLPQDDTGQRGAGVGFRRVP